MNKIQKSAQEFSDLKNQKSKIIKNTQPAIDELTQKIDHEQERYQQLLRAQENSKYFPVIMTLIAMIIVLICFSGLL